MPHRLSLLRCVSALNGLLPIFPLSLQPLEWFSAVEGLQGPVHPVILHSSASDQKNFTLQAALSSLASPTPPAVSRMAIVCVSQSPATMATIQGISKVFQVQAMLSAQDSVSEAPAVAVS